MTDSYFENEARFIAAPSSCPTVADVHRGNLYATLALLDEVRIVRKILEESTAEAKKAYVEELFKIMGAPIDPSITAITESDSDE